jgi:hypothetical protein
LADKEFLLRLYDAHLSDLLSMFPDQGDVFICPICLITYFREDIFGDNLSEGHIWPEYIRQKSGSEKAANQRVLLCKKCNNTSGSHGDKHMQVMEQVREGEETGELFGNRLVEVIETPGERPVRLRVQVRRNEDRNSMTVTGKLDKKGNFVSTNPKDKERFLELINRGEKVSIIVHPPRNLSPELTRAGWITSAYLLAFYCLGYRYILHPALNPVRDYILQSFDPVAEKTFENPSSGGFCIREYEEQFFTDPEFVLIIPIDDTTFVHLQVNFLRYQVRLPFHFMPQVLTELILSRMPNFRERLPELKKTGAALFVPILCTKANAHECLYNYLMGKSTLSIQRPDYQDI